MKNADAFKPCKAGTLQALRELLDASKLDIPEHLPPMSAGVFGYLSYDTVRLVEKLPCAKPDPVGMPDAFLMRPGVMVIFDAVKDELTIVTTVRPQKRMSAKTAYFRAVDRLAEIQDALDTKSAHAPSADGLDGIAPGHHLEHDARGLHGHGRPSRRTTSRPAISSRSCCPSASRRASTCRPSRSTGRCAA